MGRDSRETNPASAGSLGNYAPRPAAEADRYATTLRAFMKTQLVEEAKTLKSEHGENPEYDRGLVELVTFATGRTTDDLFAVCVEIGVDYGAIYPAKRR